MMGAGVFVVTGGGRGIGKALSLALAKRGHAVLIVGRNEDDLSKTAKQSSLIQYACADVSIASDRQRIFDALAAVPSIHGLIHNAGVIEPIVPIASIQEDLWKQCMAINVDAPLFLTQLLIEKLSNGRVLNIGSGAGFFPVKGWSAYCVSKAALSMLTACWQKEVRQTAFAYVMPGIIDTEMQARIRRADHMNEEKQHFFIRLKKNDQLLKPETVALFLCWLLLDLDKTQFSSKHWDIYDTSHHEAWLVPPHVVPPLE